MEPARKRRLAILLIPAIALVGLQTAAWMLLPHCRIRNSKEAVLKQNLGTLRKTIDAYTYDKRKAPQSLDDLITAGYLKKIPIDPFTNQADWQTVREDTWNRAGIKDVHSASPEISTEGMPYITW